MELKKPDLIYCSPLPPKQGGFYYREQHLKNLRKYFDVTIRPLLSFASSLIVLINLMVFLPLVLIIKLIFKPHSQVVYYEYDLASQSVLIFPLTILLRLCGEKNIFRLHEDYTNKSYGWLLRLWDNFWLMLAADIIIVHTYEHAKLLWSINTRKGTVLLSGLDVKKHHNKPERHTIIIPGFIARWKGHDVFIDALYEVRKEIPDVKLIIAGKMHDRAFFDELTNKILWAGLQDNVELHTDYLEREDMQKLLKRASVAVLPYKRINFSAALLDCIDWEIPTIVSSIPQFKELAPGLPEVNVQLGSPYPLASQIVTLLKNKKARNAVKEKMKILKARYDWKPIVKKEAEIIYDELRH